MRISDWSSDVCSSDLPAKPAKAESAAQTLAAASEATSSAAEPQLADGAELVRTTVREALRDAMAEEMRADERVFVMGEEVAQYQGAYTVTQRLLDECGAKRVIDTPITETDFAGNGLGAPMRGPPTSMELWSFN